MKLRVARDGVATSKSSNQGFESHYGSNDTLSHSGTCTLGVRTQIVKFQ